MAKQILNVGTSNNDKTGDTLRAGGLKIKANFEELYTALANDGSNISGGNLLKSGSYADLRNKPDFADIAVSGSYNDLLDKPNISTVVGAPTLLTGSDGDTIGNIAFDSNNLYVATSDYTDGQANIWKYVPWGGGGTTQGYSYNHNQDPTETGGFSLNDEDPAQANVAYIATTDVDGNDIHPFYQYVFENQLSFLLEIISRTNPQNRALFRVTGSREMTANGVEYYELDLVHIMHADNMTIGTGMWDLHFDFTGTANTGAVTFEGVAVIGGGTASGDGNGYGTLELVPDNDLYVISPTGDFGYGGQYLVIDPTSPNHIHIRAGGPQDQAAAQLILGGEKANVTVRDQDNSFTENHEVLINTQSNDGSAINLWQFKGNADLELPTNGGIVFDRADTTIRVGMGFHIASGEGISLDAIDLTDPENPAYNSWYFSPIGQMYFPDGRIQETAWTGGRVVTVPTHSTGVSGDLEGDLAFSNGYIYYCTADYGQVGHQVSVATAYNGATALNTNSFQLTKSADTLQIAVGDIISDSDGGATSIVDSVSSDDNYTYVGTGAMAYQAVFPLTFTSTDYVSGGNIWKRVAWSNDTW